MYGRANTTLSGRLSCIVVLSVFVLAINHCFPQVAIADNEDKPAALRSSEAISLSENTPNIPVIGSHDANKTLNLKPLYLSSVIEMSSFKDLRQEASYEQSITLADAINYVLKHGLPLKISQESLRYQRFQTLWYLLT